MKILPFKKIDAFASKSSSGNPAAVIFLNRLEELSEAEKLKIAKELKGFVNEVGFVCPSTKTDYKLCFYSSEREVALCGHATIAIANDIIAENEALQARKTLTFTTRTDHLVVENHYRDERSVFISAPAPRFSNKRVAIKDITEALNIRPEDIDILKPIQIVNGGLETLIVPMDGIKSILGVVPEIQTLKEFCIGIGVDIVLLYSSEVAFKESRYRTRVFAPTFGYLEDPATGSGNSAFGYYLISYDTWHGEKIQIEQNGFRDAPNYIQLIAKTTGTGSTRVWFGGSAIVKICGQYILY